MFSPFLPPTSPAPDAAQPTATPDPIRSAHERRAAVAACLLPLLGIAAAAAALLLGAGPPGPVGWLVGATGLVAHARLLHGVARRAGHPR